MVMKMKFFILLLSAIVWADMVVAQDVTAVDDTAPHSAMGSAVAPLSADEDALRIPNDDDVLVRTIDASSPYYFPALLATYLSEPEKLTNEQFFYLYYGYAFTDMYKPHQTIEAEARVLESMQQIMNDPTEEGVNTLINNALEVMESDPFSPKNLNILAYAYGLLENWQEQERFYLRFNKIIHTIEHSGTGIKESSPWHILMFSHAADVVYARGEEIKRREVVSRTTEFIFLPMKNSQGLNGYYFDFSRIYSTRPDKPTQNEQKRGWTLNNIPL